MYYLVAFVCGALAGGIVMFLVIQNNAKKAAEIEQRLKDIIGKS